MSRLASLDEVLFPVTLAPLTACTGGHELPLSHHRAVVDTRGGRVLSVVGREYRLVTHAQARDLAFECARAAFPETRQAEWNVASVDATSSGSTCFFDLQHNSATLDFRGLPGACKPDIYGPFVRVVNSYNHNRALAFDLGYYRKVCRNGLILRDTMIRFQMNHLRRDIRKDARFDIAQENLAKQRIAFQSFLARLQSCAVPAMDMTRLACTALGFQAPGLPAGAGESALSARDQARLEAWKALEAAVNHSCRRHAGELGENAYAVLNAVTDIASRPPLNPLVHRDRHSLQRRAGKWLGEFAGACSSVDFDLETYLGSLGRAITPQ